MFDQPDVIIRRTANCEVEYGIGDSWWRTYADQEAAVKVGSGMSVPAVTINEVCGTGVAAFCGGGGQGNALIITVSVDDGTS